MKQGYPTYDLERFNSMLSLTSTFKDDRDCKEFLIRQRWADGDYICPYCGKHHCFRRSDGLFRCTGCGKNFSVLIGTIFEHTKLSLVKWFMAMYYVSSHKKGVASHQLAREIATTQKTAWYVLQKIRTLFAQDGSIELADEVECDEAYIGGNTRI